MKWLKRLLADQSEKEPIVIANQICRAIEERIQVIQGGRKIFPFNRLIIQLHCQDGEEENILRAAFDDRQLQRHVQEFLSRREVNNWRELRLTIETSIVPAGSRPAERFTISCQRDEAKLPSAELIVIRGEALPARYKLRELTRIGRTEEVLDLQGRLVRRNDLIFADRQDEINLSVGRIQSRIEYDPARAGFVVFDEDSRHGTSVERDGRMMTATSQRGIPLRDGDTLHLGRARCRFVEEPADHHPQIDTDPTD